MIYDITRGMLCTFDALRLLLRASGPEILEAGSTQPGSLPQQIEAGGSFSGRIALSASNQAGLHKHGVHAYAYTKTCSLRSRNKSTRSMTELGKQP